MAGKQQKGGQRNAAVNDVNICCCCCHSWHMLFVMYAEVIAQTDKCTWDK